MFSFIPPEKIRETCIKMEHWFKKLKINFARSYLH